MRVPMKTRASIERSTAVAGLSNTCFDEMGLCHLKKDDTFDIATRHDRDAPLTIIVGAPHSIVERLYTVKKKFRPTPYSLALVVSVH